MVKQFIALEWKSFLRAASFKGNLFIKILAIIGILYFVLLFLVLGSGAYFMMEEAGLPPLETVNKFFIYYLVFDLVFRFFLQKTPVLNIKPLLYINIKKNAIVHYVLGKTVISFFNSIHLFFFIPFSVVLVLKNFNPIGVITWFFSMVFILLANNFINILADKKDVVFYGLISVFVLLGGLQYFDIINVSIYTQKIFDFLYTQPFSILIPIGLLIGLYYWTFQFFKKNLYLDAGLTLKHEEAKTEEFRWLNNYGILGTFFKNDIKLIKRNKRARMTVIMSVLFLFYGLLFMTNSVDMYKGPIFTMLGGLFVSGGFIFSFGQFVPSWDSSYYPLMMSQNIQYKEYLNSKWWLMVVITVISTLVASFYLYFGWEVYLAIVGAAVYNIGVNAYIVLLAGAYTRTPIDLTSTKNAFGDKKAFNVKTLLLVIPQIIIPISLYGLGTMLYSSLLGLFLIIAAGLIGFALKNKVFTFIEKTYKTNKYITILAYKQK
jgi:hypothetical protein